MSGRVLVCFAVSQEAKPFQKLVRSQGPQVRVLVTGMGPRNAERAVRTAIQNEKPSHVFTCGFAGALAPELKIADLVCSLEMPMVGAKAVRFIATERVAVTVADKSALHAQGADAVEMESATIARLCKEQGIPCVTLRAISDLANEDLPLNFNELLDGQENLSPAKLALAIIKAPHKIPALMRLGKNSALAAEKLAQALVRALATS
jgi:adenosylhomocysteine nucleosidase